MGEVRITDEMVEAARAKGRELAGNQPGALVEAMAEIAEQGARAALSAALSGMAEPVAWMNQHGAVTRFGHEKWVELGQEVTPLYATPPATGLTEENERLREALRRLVTTYATFEDGDGNPCPDVAFGIAALQTEGK